MCQRLVTKAESLDQIGYSSTWSNKLWHVTTHEMYEQSGTGDFSLNTLLTGWVRNLNMPDGCGGITLQSEEPIPFVYELHSPEWSTAAAVMLASAFPCRLLPLPRIGCSSVARRLALTPGSANQQRGAPTVVSWMSWLCGFPLLQKRHQILDKQNGNWNRKQTYLSFGSHGPIWIEACQICEILCRWRWHCLRCQTRWGIQPWDGGENKMTFIHCACGRISIGQMGRRRLCVTWRGGCSRSWTDRPVSTLKRCHLSRRSAADF